MVIKDIKLYKLSLFETLRSLISCTVETHTTYKFIDLEYGVKEGTATFEELRTITKSEEWKNELKKEVKEKQRATFICVCGFKDENYHIWKAHQSQCDEYKKAVEGKSIFLTKRFPGEG